VIIAVTEAKQVLGVLYGGKTESRLSGIKALVAACLRSARAPDFNVGSRLVVSLSFRADEDADEGKVRRCNNDD